MKLTPGTIDTAPAHGLLRRDALAAAAVFCVLSFAISSFRASLNPDIVFQLWHGKRMVLIGAGACVYWLAIAGPGSGRPGLRTFRRMAMLGVPGLAALFALSMGWDLWVTGETEDLVARNLRWILLWSGYFGTGLAAWLALTYGEALAAAEKREAAIRGGPEPSTAPDGGIWVKTGRQTIRIPHESVEWVQAEGNYVRIHGHDGAHGLIRSTLAAIEVELESGAFVRVHRSALCRRTAIRGYRRKPSGAMLALLASGAEAPLGRSFVRHVFEPQPPRDAAHGDMDDTVSRSASEAERA